ncbi:AAA domain-containing protein [Nocardia sp. NPDC050717]|uniref:AAA domain-containing protein n=1 Tax=Nocardia sp. NPDC050717 TaxID=3157221 RepID=UPI0033F7545B
MIDTANGEQVPTDLAGRGARLFDFLAHAQQLRVSRIKDIATYQRDGEVIWVADLPADPAVTYQSDESGAPFLIVEKTQVPPAPAPPPILRDWLVGTIDDPEIEPELEPRRFDAAGAELELADHPDVATAHAEWLPRWCEWASVARVKLAVLALYQTLYEVYTRYEGERETFEVVFGLGLLTWQNSAVGSVRRHVLTVPVTVRFDSGYGALSVALDPTSTGYTPELQDIVEAGQMSAPGDLQRAEDQARTGDVSAFERADIAALVRMFVNCINPDAEYRDDLSPAAATSSPVAYYAPAIVLRKRSNRGMVNALRAVADNIRNTGLMPAGMMNLVDPDHEPVVTTCDDTGAIVHDGPDKFLPLPLNDVQLRILDHVDRHAHTLVQGPPGTGKTHTAAALITHLLAQGKRVLITAHTDRALHEVRNRLPDEIKPLCVTVVGDSRTELEELKTSVSRINQAAAEHDPLRSKRTAAATEAQIEEQRRIRARLHRDLVDLRERDVTEHRIGDLTGTIADIATQWVMDRDVFEWTTGLLETGSNEQCPFSADELIEWLGLLRDPDLADPEAAAPDLVAAADLPSADDFEHRHAQEEAAGKRRESYSRHHGTHTVAQLLAMSPQERAALGRAVAELDTRAKDFAGRPDAWVRAAAEAIRAGHQHGWQGCAQIVDALISQADAALSAIGFADVQVPEGDLAPLLSLAENLRSHIEQGGKFEIKTDGTPKLGFLTPRVVKDAQPLFENVRVDDRIPTRVEQLTAFLETQNCRRLLGRLDAAWPVQIPVAGTLRDRVAAHRTARAVLSQVLTYGDGLAATSNALRNVGIAVPDWAKAEDVAHLLEAFAAVEAELAWRQTSEPLAALTEQLDRWCRDPRATDNLHALADAVRARDIAAYRHAGDRLNQLHQLRHRFARRRELDARIAGQPGLHAAVIANLDDAAWARRFTDFRAAWQWNAMGTWLASHNVGEVNGLCHRLDDVEEQLRVQATILATTRAWDRAIDRLTYKARADLKQYSDLVKDLGKGTGQNAARKRVGVQRALAKCRPAVPVWIMPIYRVVEQFEIKPDMFDVVVVDEASQAGVAAVFLQYLAPRVVVIGDDKQVSPSAVGVNEDELVSLSKQYLAGDQYADTWKLPKRSLFDEAAMRYPKKLTLVEHRRCVPEIIGFSNKIAYEPEGVSLIPVRRFGSDRLPPVRAVYVEGGQEIRSKVNEVEADRIVEQIAACVADPAYDGKTFGVITLLGTEQAKVIWRKLIDVVPPEELEARRLLCGSAADFQGAERDVVFLSLVAAPREGGRLTSQTKDETVQRYNVAVSRARDQVWLFHSVTTQHLANSEDMRFRLLDYFLGVQAGVEESDSSPERFSDDTLRNPFESLFEQRVYNGLVDRGYQVTAHHTETACDLDMVVTGRGGQLAVQCDSDRWQGAEAYRAELALQRDLERCEWPIHRIRQADFIVDQDGALDALCAVLGSNGILPRGEDPVEEIDTVAESVEPPQLETDLLDEFVWERPEAAPSATAAADEPAVEIGDIGLTDQARWLKPAPSAPESTALRAEPSADALREYSEFTGALESPTTAPHATIVADLCGIVGVEGPVTGLRLRAAYVSAAKTRERDNVKAAIDRALHAAVAHGRLLVDDPLDLGDPGLMAYRVPDQPLSRWRLRGPRQIEQIPPRELAEVMARHGQELGWTDQGGLFRAVIKAFGQVRLTGNASAALERVIGLARSQGEVR